VFCFSTNFSETFLFLRRNERDMIINLHASLLFLLDFNEPWIFSKYFRKIFKYQISWKSVQWEPSFPIRTDWRTDMTKVIVAFRNFANATKMGENEEAKWRKLSHNKLQTNSTNDLENLVVVMSNFVCKVNVWLHSWQCGNGTQQVRS